jgi:hypothetical protein
MHESIITIVQNWVYAINDAEEFMFTSKSIYDSCISNIDRLDIE